MDRGDHDEEGFYLQCPTYTILWRLVREGGEGGDGGASSSKSSNSGGRCVCALWRYMFYGHLRDDFLVVVPRWRRASSPPVASLLLCLPTQPTLEKNEFDFSDSRECAGSPSRKKSKQESCVRPSLPFSRVPPPPGQKERSRRRWYQRWKIRRSKKLRVPAVSRLFCLRVFFLLLSSPWHLEPPTGKCLSAAVSLEKSFSFSCSICFFLC